MNHTVDERRDITYQRHLGTLFEILALVILNLQQLCSQQFAFLLILIVGVFGLRLFLVKVIEQPQREKQQHDGHHYGNQHQVELALLLIILVGTRLELTVLTGGLLQVEIHVAVSIALLFIIDGCIGHTELFANRGNQIGSLIDDAIIKGLFEIVECRLVIANLPVARCQRTISTCYLIHIAIAFEYLQRILGKESRKHLLVYPHWVYELHGRKIIHHQLLARLRVHEMLAQGL